MSALAAAEYYLLDLSDGEAKACNIDVDVINNKREVIVVVAIPDSQIASFE